MLGIISIGDAARLDDDEEEVGEALKDICRPYGRHCQALAAYSV